MLERYVEQQAAVYSALLDKDLKTMTKNLAMLTDDEQRMAEDLIQLLKPLKTVTTLMSSETSPTTSMILPLKHLILKSMVTEDGDSATIKEAKTAIAQDLEKRYTDPALTTYLQKATALDPRFKSLPSHNEMSKLQIYQDLIKDILQSQAMARPSTEEQHAAYSPPQKRSAMAELFGEVFKTQEQEKPFEAIIEEEVSTYRSAPSIHVDANPFIWWKTNKAKFPHVAELARRHLCVPGTSVASERIFSTAGDIVDANRSRLGADNVDKLIFLQKNMKIQ
ncbi:hypothetical protein WMY93_011734 [Mugilogobius chulae]|uniref:HAT C-terminal dimerisation domain-containing protein n=1 Tax=Mugilogobius chulae TaxID=88201 RepID=A0AAW0P3F3_9GOBI